MPGRCIIGPKVIANPNTVYEADVTFQAADFSIATGYTALQGPLSLSIDVQNNMLAGLYFGLDIYYDIGYTTIADRAHIGYAAPGGRKSIGPASVPQLAQISHNITKIVVRCYSPYIYSSSNIGTISLIIDAPVTITAPQAFIGADSQVYNPNFGITYELDSVVVHASTGLILGPLTVPTGVRYKVKWIAVKIPPTPSFAGDIALYALTTDRPPAIAALWKEWRSISSGYVIDTFMPDFILDPQMILTINGQNFNTTIDFTCHIAMRLEVIF